MISTSRAQGNRTLDTARAYLDAGFSILPISRDGTKKPDWRALPSVWDEEQCRGRASWKPFTEHLPGFEDIDKWYGGPFPSGIGLISGAVSGALEQIDFDKKAEIIFAAWRALVEEERPGLVARLSICETPRRPCGYHVRYRCPDIDIPGNTKLALDPSAPGKDRVLIETRGEGGYCIVPGSPAECHETKREYVHLSGPVLPPVISPDERETLLRCAKSFNRDVEEDVEEEECPRQKGPGLLPGEDYNLRGPDWVEILGPGWQCVGGGAGGERRWRRPGKEGPGWSATTGFCRGKDGADLFRVFSSNAHPFEDGESYSKFRAFTFLRHRGDYKAAAKDLGRQGFGTERRHEDNGQAGEPPPAPEPWDDPLPLGEVPEVEPFPLNVLPQPLQDFAHAVAESMNCPVDFAAVPMLTIAGAAIGASRAVQIKEGWTERPALYTAIIGRSGGAKTPAQEKAARPLYDTQAKIRQEHDRKLEEWKKDNKDTRGERPAEKTLWVEDVTTEKFATLLMENKRGIIQIADELTGLVNRLDCYKSGKGGDRQFYLSGWSGKPVRVDRKNRDDSILVPHPFIALTGGLPPTMLSTLRGGQSLFDGWMERFLFSWAEEKEEQEEQWKVVNAKLALTWSGTIGVLRDLEMVEDKETGPRPYFAPFTKDAEKAWQQFTARLARELNDPILPECLHGAYKKLKGYRARLALILQMLRHAHKEAKSDKRVNGESITRAARLITYFQSHARKVYAVIDADPRVAEARRVLRWIEGQFRENAKNAKGLREISQRDLHRGVWGGSREVNEGLEVINLLLRHGFLRPVPGEKRAEGPGRKPGPRYEAHPSLFS